MVEPQHFFVIGAQRSGTTLLHECLDRHPDVAMNWPVRPEPKHFLEDDSELIDVEEYDRRYFADGDAPVRGEKGTTYLERPDAGERILRRFPAARFVVILRDPVERAISNWRFSRRHGVEVLDASEALTPEAEHRAWDPSRFSTSPFAYLRRGCYAQQLDRWAEVVDRDRICVLTLDDVLVGAGLPRLQHFLGLDVHPGVSVRGRVNANDAPSSGEGELAADRRRLAAWFRIPNAELAARWGVDVGGWET